MQTKWPGAATILYAGCLIIGYLGGCQSPRDDHHGQCPILIPKEQLPTGWIMLPSSEMPPIDKVPWWVQNPQLLQGEQAKNLLVEDRPTSASVVWAVIYGKGDDRVPVFSLTYSTQEEMETEYRLFQKGYVPDKGILGILRDRRNSILVVSLSECHDREFFTQYYRSAITDEQARPAAVTPTPSQSPRTASPPQASEKELSLDCGNGVSMKLALIPAGRFQMGSPSGESGRYEGEGPQHEVAISRPFYMGVCEVTQDQYRAVMGGNPSNWKGGNLPVERVSWHDATEFCRRLSQQTGRAARLPTEAQWEYACRAGTSSRFSFGDSDGQLDSYVWYTSNSGGQTHPVGQKQPNAWGLYDMHGNVWEWCSDWYDSYANANSIDPQGPPSGSSRVLRGGSWADYYVPQFCRSALRNMFSPDLRFNYLGFRVSVDLK